MKVATSRRGLRIALLAGCIVATVSLLAHPVSTRQGVNFSVQTHRIPLAVKAMDFIDRHYHYRQLAGDITRDCRSDRERAEAIFAWTRAHIRKTPKDWPVVDDHILNIIIRGHGLEDQMADVFTTLSTYAGVPGFWRVVRLPEDGQKLVLSFARLEGRWAMFDVANGLIFADSQGRPADVHDLMRSQELVEHTTGGLAPSGIPYWRYVEQLGAFEVPTWPRARAQMPLPRLNFEVRRALGMASVP